MTGGFPAHDIVGAGSVVLPPPFTWIDPVGGSDTFPDVGSELQPYKDFTVALAANGGPRGTYVIKANDVAASPLSTIALDAPVTIGQHGVTIIASNGCKTYTGTSQPADESADRFGVLFTASGAFPATGRALFEPLGRQIQLIGFGVKNKAANGRGIEWGRAAADNEGSKQIGVIASGCLGDGFRFSGFHLDNLEVTSSIASQCGLTAGFGWRFIQDSTGILATHIKIRDSWSVHNGPIGATPSLTDGQIGMVSSSATDFDFGFQLELDNFSVKGFNIPYLNAGFSGFHFTGGYWEPIRNGVTDRPMMIIENALSDATRVGGVYRGTFDQVEFRQAFPDPTGWSANVPIFASVQGFATGITWRELLLQDSAAAKAAVTATNPLFKFNASAKQQHLERIWACQGDDKGNAFDWVSDLSKLVNLNGIADRELTITGWGA